MYKTVQYWSNRGSVSEGFRSHHRRIRLRRAIAPSISVRWRWNFRINVDNDLGYHVCNREGLGVKEGRAACIVVAWSRSNYCSTLKLISMKGYNILKWFFHFNIAFTVIYNVLNFRIKIQRERASLLLRFEVVLHIDGNRNHGFLFDPTEDGFFFDPAKNVFSLSRQKMDFFPTKVS